MLDAIGSFVNISIVTMLIPLLYIFQRVIDVLPDATLPANAAAAVETVVYYAWKMNHIIPVATMVQILILEAIVDAYIIIARGAFWLIRTVRGG